MANSEIFRTVFKGYSKEEVVAYIDQMNRQMVQLQDELSMAINRLQQMEDQQKDVQQEYERVSADEAAIREAVVAELTPVLKEQMRKEVEEALRPELEKEIRHQLEGELTPKYEKIVRTEVTNRAQLQAEELQDLRHRAQLYDENREILAELMIRAKNDATGIIKDAEVQAKALKEEAEQKFRLLMSDYELLKSNLLTAKNEASDKLMAAMKTLNEFEKRFSIADHDVAHSQKHLNDR